MTATRTLLLLSLAAAAPARAGVTATFQAKGHPLTTVQVEGNRARVDDGKEITIFDGDARKLVTLRPAERSYVEVTEAELRAQGARLRGEMEALKARLGPEQRAQLEAATDKAKGKGKERPKPAFEATGRKDRVAGQACEVYRQIADGKPVQELCLIPWSAGLVTREDLAAFEKMSQLLMTVLEEAGGASDLLRDTRASLAAMPGFPARTVEIDEQGKAGEPEELVKVVRGPLPPGTFAVPPGYTRAEGGQ
jgi:hypothetical protein